MSRPPKKEERESNQEAVFTTKNVIIALAWIFSLLLAFFFGEGIMYLNHYLDNDFSLKLEGLPSNLDSNQNENFVLYIKNQWKDGIHVKINPMISIDGGSYKFECIKCSLDKQLIPSGEMALDLRVEAENAKELTENKLCINVFSILDEKNQNEVCHKFEVINREE